MCAECGDESGPTIRAMTAEQMQQRLNQDAAAGGAIWFGDPAALAAMGVQAAPGEAVNAEDARRYMDTVRDAD